METFFNSNLFAGFSTILTGLIAWLIYENTKANQKINAAIIILSEIQNAELAIDSIKQNKIINDYTSVMPNNSWYQYKHLFVKDFDVDGVKLLDFFFLNCSLSENQIKIFKNYETLAREEEVKIIQHKLLELADKYKDGGKIESNNEYVKHKNAILEIFHNETYWFQPNAAKNKVVEYISTIKPIINTNVGVKLKKIANMDKN
jgi:hypothetical protein